MGIVRAEGKDGAAGEELGNDAAGAEDVGRERPPGVEDSLGRAVLACADEWRVRVGLADGGAEVDELDLQGAISSDNGEDVLGLAVGVAVSFGVHVLKRR